MKHNKHTILSAACTNRLPVELLGGVCWIEVGGDPNFIDRVAFEVRAFDWSGPPVIDKSLTVTRIPTRTSFGSVSIQLRTAAQTLGMDPAKMTNGQLRNLASCLQRDVYNIDTAARHLCQLVDNDKFSSPLTMEQVRIVGARYNRGIGLSIEQTLMNNCLRAALHAIYAFGLLFIVSLAGSKYDWMADVDPTITSGAIEDGSGNRVAFLGVTLVVAILAESVVALKARSALERASAMVLILGAIGAVLVL